MYRGTIDSMLDAPDYYNDDQPSIYDFKKLEDRLENSHQFFEAITDIIFNENIILDRQILGELFEECGHYLNVEIPFTLPMITRLGEKL
jgi:hypothetical protein